MSFRTTISYVLFPLTMWYAVGVAVRNLFYALGIKRSEAPHITTIGVGNLCTGGSGKTPQVEYLLRLLSKDYRVAMLSRGYKRKTKGYLLDDGAHDPQLLGDEPAMMAAKFPHVKVAVCENRVEGVKRLMEKPEIVESPDNPEQTEVPETPDVIVLDDVFQHRRIKPNINILLTEFRHPFFRDHILPYGNLREFRSGRYRASIVIVTKCPAMLNPVDKHNIIADLRLQNYQKVFFSYFKYGEIKSLDGRVADIDLHKLDGVLAVTGIAHPEPMIDEIKKSCRVQHLAFADHHNYSKRDIVRIREAFEAIKGERKVILTTEKDAARLQGLTGDLPVFVLPVEVAFHKEKDLDFDQVIVSSVKENISFLSKLSIWS
ncbi:MAG: tetraacyldisaccharide 4'-kinase [Bacteroidales bacterium]|nr:tetraacyldisaccharide 4'-kinase [Bacteroidales bacterium]